MIEDGLKSSGLAVERAAELAGAAGGSPGWAIRAASEPKLLEERVAVVRRALDWIVADPGSRVVTAIRMGDTFSKKRPEVFGELETVLGVWRDALLLKTSVPDATTFPAQTATLVRTIESWSLLEVHRALVSVRQCIADLEANVRPRLAIESMVLQWPKA
jgi:hypothetical protein